MNVRRPDVFDSIMALRADAMSRGMTELALVYGWSAMRLSAERLTESVRRLLNGSAK